MKVATIVKKIFHFFPFLPKIWMFGGMVDTGSLLIDINSSSLHCRSSITIPYHSLPTTSQSLNHLNINIDHYERLGDIILWPIHTVINADERIALVGKNGVGKSTLLRIMTGNITDAVGSIENVGNMTIGYLEQIHFMDESRTVRDELRDAFSTLRKLESSIREEEKKMEETGEYTEYTELIEQYALLGGYTYENEIERVARGIGIFSLLGRTLHDVSWGERTKIALAKTLLAKPEFLFLDEPTNFIDLESVKWLEKYLEESWKWGYVIVSHDREFLDRTCNKVIEVLGAQGIIIYIGDYSYSVETKELEHARAVKKYEEQETYIDTEKTLINRFRAGSRAGFAKSRERALEKVDRLDKPVSEQIIEFRFDTPKDRVNETILRIEDGFVGRKEPLFYIREAVLAARERIWIIGENGVGKSTFLKTILWSLSEWSLTPEKSNETTGKIKLLEGTLHIAPWVAVGYYSQMHESLNTTESILENFHSHRLLYSPEQIGWILLRYGFAYHDSSKIVWKLSWGERSRLLFSMIAERPYHLLILDEPTNHLDSDARESLEQALSLYTGTLLFISHDRYFVNKIAEKLWIIEDGELMLSYGNYDDYEYKREHGISLDISLFTAEGELDLVLEEKLGIKEARRIKEKYARKRK